MSPRSGISIAIEPATFPKHRLTYEELQMRRQWYKARLATLAIAFVTACGGQLSTPTATAPTAAPTGAASGATEAPRFSQPTEITNPFYPVSLIGQSIS